MNDIHRNANIKWINFPHSEFRYCMIYLKSHASETDQRENRVIEHSKNTENVLDFSDYFSQKSFMFNGIASIETLSTILFIEMILSVISCYWRYNFIFITHAFSIIQRWIYWTWRRYNNMLFGQLGRIDVICWLNRFFLHVSFFILELCGWQYDLMNCFKLKSLSIVYSRDSTK